MSQKAPGIAEQRYPKDPPPADVTAVWARTHPSTSEFVPIVTAVPAEIEPTSTLLEPMTIAVPSTHKTFSARAPFSKTKELPVEVVIAVLVWKINEEFELLRPSRVHTPAPNVIIPEAK
jgi:hypothetical protein